MVGVCPVSHATHGPLTCFTSPNFDPKFPGNGGLPTHKEEHRPSGVPLLVTHVIPVYIFRKDSIDIPGSLAVVALYLLFLRYMGTSSQEVYGRILSEPMPTIGSYLSSRLH